MSSVVGNRKSPSLWEPLEKLKLLSLEEVVTIDDINMNTTTLFPVHSSPSVRCPDLTFYLSLGKTN